MREFCIDLLIALIVFVVTVGLLCFGCTHEECSRKGDYRCVGTSVEYCSGSHKWEFLDDCKDVIMLDGSEVDWLCCPDGNDVYCAEICEQ